MQLAVTQRHEDEAASSSIYNQGNLGNPAVYLPDFVNNESIRNKDLVLWVTSGLYHIPTSEDAPSTPTTGNSLGFALLPFNLHDENAATDMADFTQIDSQSNSKVKPPVQAYAAAASCVPNLPNVAFSGVFSDDANLDTTSAAATPVVSRAGTAQESG